MRATRRAVWLAAGSCAAGLGLLLVAGPSVLVGDVACGAEPGTVKEPTGAPGQPSSVPVGLRKLMDVPLRDPSICVGPDGTYYLTGTSEPFWGFNNDNGIRVWKSGDMVSWQPLGTVWRYGEIFGKDSFDHVGYEGMFLFKRQGRYYLCCSEQIDGRYSCMVATSTSLLGPYSARYEAIRHGGHNAFFVDASGQWWSTFFGPPYSERAAVLPVHFDAEGRLACGKLSP